MFSGIFYQLLSMFSFGTSNVLWKFPQKSIPVFKIIVLRTIVSVLLFGVVAYLFGEVKGNISDWLVAIVISLVSFLGLVFYNLSIKESKVSHTITVTSTSAVFGVFTALIAYDEEPKLVLLLSLSLIVIGLFLLESKKQHFNLSRSTFFAILAAFFWGTTFALFRIPVEAIGNYNFSLVLESSVLLGALLLYFSFKRGKPTHVPTTRTYLTIVSIGILAFLGVLFYNLAVVKVDVSTLSVIGAFTPVISIVLSHILLKEKFTFIQYLGMICTLIGVILLSY
jgi:uncharacterized membrane protein